MASSVRKNFSTVDLKNSGHTLFEYPQTTQQLPLAALIIFLQKTL